MLRSALSATVIFASLIMFAPAADACGLLGRHHRTPRACCNTTCQSSYTYQSNYGGYGDSCGNSTTYYSSGHHSSNYCPSTTYGASYGSSGYNDSGSCCGGSPTIGYRGVQNNSGQSGGYSYFNGGYSQGNNYQNYSGPEFQSQRFSGRYMGVGSGW